MTIRRPFALLVAFALAFAPIMRPDALAAAPKSGGAGKTQTRISSAASYLPLPSFTTATAPDRSGLPQMLTVDVGFDIPNADLRKRVELMAPRLRDIIRGAISQYALNRLRTGAPPDPTVIAQLVQAAVDRALGRQDAKVLLSNVMLIERR